MNCHVMIAAAFLAATAFAAPALADDALVARLADGKPWSVKLSEGPTVKMTFNADGTGLMKMGFMSRKIGWTKSADGICLTGLPSGRGDNCLTLSTAGNGLAGRSSDGKSMLLTRG
jgi:hypothetical protein